MATEQEEYYTDLRSRQSVERLMQPEGGTAVIDMWAPWCGPCKAMAPYYEAVAKKYADEPVDFYKINTQSHPELGEAFNVRSIPTLLFIHDGEVLDVLVGKVSGKELQKKVDWLLSKARGEGFLTRLLGLGGKKKS